MGCFNISNERKKFSKKTLQQKVEISNNYFQSINSKYILQHILSYLPKKKQLEIIKYNKMYQERLGVNDNDYKEFCEKNTPIEIEIIVNDYEGKIIDISDDKEYPYVHIYFDESKKEIKTHYLKKSHKVKKIKILLDYQINSFRKLFCDCQNIKSLSFIKFYRNNIQDMSYMFSGCIYLQKLNLSNMTTDNVEDMSHMFEYCGCLKELNVCNFNTNNVTDMSHMFYRCSSLEELNLSNFDTNKVEYMDYMFSECSSLEELNLFSFNTNNVSNMNYMFSKCSSLKELNLSNFKTNNVINMNNMFRKCSSLKKLNLSNFKTDKVIDINDMFYSCNSNLKVEIDISVNKRIKYQNPKLIIV